MTTEELTAEERTQLATHPDWTHEAKLLHLYDAALARAPACEHCGKPAACMGCYEMAGAFSYACSECCGHGNEDGRCYPIADVPARYDAALARAEEAETQQAVLQSALDQARKESGTMVTLYDMTNDDKLAAESALAEAKALLERIEAELLKARALTRRCPDHDVIEADRLIRSALELIRASKAGGA